MDPQSTNKRPSVIPRSDIPISPGGDAANLEVRPFLAHRVLGSVLPRSAVSLAWTRAHCGKDVALRSHPTSGLLIILEGRAILSGGLERHVEAGDVITVPRNQQYGFTAVGRAGLHALHVAFDDPPTSHGVELGSLQQLLARNEERLQTTLNNSFFSLLRRRGIDSERKRVAMRDGARVFSDAFQMMMLTRQATCRDESYAAVFHEHMVEELGHNQLLQATNNSTLAKDALLRALSSWFPQQMVVLDNAEKAVVTLVLETGAYYMAALSKPLFEGDASQQFFDTHAAEDIEHKEMFATLLRDLHPRVYGRLQRVLDTSWDMVGAMTQRLAYLIELHATSS